MESSSPNKVDIHRLPPGFRFHPTDEELIVHYLKKKVTSKPLPAAIIAEIDLYEYNPWELPKEALFGEDEWYFFTPRDRKYPNGARPNRTAASGYWKATGTDKHILTKSGLISIGVKKALVFYKGRAPRGAKTDWVMHEYRVLDAMIWSNLKRKGSMRLDDWVLCRIRRKSSNPRTAWEDQNGATTAERDEHDATNMNELLLQTNIIDPEIEMVVNNNLYSECPMLPYIFASQGFASVQPAASNISFQTSDKSCIENESDDEKNLQTFGTSLNPQTKVRRKKDAAFRKQEI